MTESFFHPSSGDHFIPTEHCRGPWDPESCHAGPPGAVVARSLERLVPEARLTRLTLDLVRPIPMAGFRVRAEVRKPGRTVTTTEAEIIDDADRVCVRASGLHLAERDVGPLPSVADDVPVLSEAEPGPFPLRRKRHDRIGFTDGVEVRYPPGEDHLPGPTTLWMRTIPLFPDEEPSAFQRICPLADCGNATARNAELEQVGFVNPDLTVVLHRDPVGEWLGSATRSHWESSGIGLADALLFDEFGTVGRAMQTLVLTPTGTPQG